MRLITPWEGEGGYFDFGFTAPLQNFYSLPFGACNSPAQGVGHFGAPKQEIHILQDVLKVKLQLKPDFGENMVNASARKNQPLITR